MANINFEQEACYAGATQRQIKLTIENIITNMTLNNHAIMTANGIISDFERVSLAELICNN
jgi:hypothetical protein